MKKSQQQNIEEEENGTDKKIFSSKKNKQDKIAATHNKLIAKIIRKKSSNWSHFKTMLKRVTCFVMLLALLLLIFTCYTEGKKGNNKKKLSEEDLDKMAEKLAKQMSKESKQKSEESKLESEETEEIESEDTVEYIEGTSLRKPPKTSKKKAAKRAKEFMKMHNSDGSVAAAWERLSSAVKGDDDMLSLAKEIKKTYKITEGDSQGERMEKMMTMLQDRNINKIADKIGNEFSGDRQVQKILKTIKEGSKTKKDEKKKKEQKDNTASEKKNLPNKKENSENKHSKVNKKQKVNSKQMNTNNEIKGILKDSDKSANTIKQPSNDKMDRKTEFKKEPKSKEDKETNTSEDKFIPLNNLVDEPIKIPSCNIDESKINENSHAYKKEQSECNIKLNDNNNHGADVEENKIPFSRFQDSVKFDIKKDVIDSSIEEDAYQKTINKPPSLSNHKRGDMGEKLLPIHSSDSTKKNQGDMGENILPINSHHSQSKQRRGDAGDNLSPLSNTPTPSTQKRGDTGETLSLTNNLSSHSKQNRGEASKNFKPDVNPPSPGKERPSEQTRLPSAIPSLQDQGDKSFNSIPGRGSLHEKEEPTRHTKSKEKQWTGEGYNFFKSEDEEPMGPPSEKEDGKLGKLSKELPLFGLLSIRESRKKDNPQKKAKVTRRAARGDTGSIDNLMESLQDHGGWNAARDRKM